ncbi:hypothetical protein R7M92_20725 [Vibrio sp. Vb2880]|uniref:DUF7716 domain-containing protein n=1 Tax=Vibrio TaxID=662 RepID=UPI00102A4187|nr:hypothetical protein [Vibrio sp. Vb2880]EHH1187243.1 hypothetical protein [Vibrio vulnificus]TMX37196.1 hypothetical protein DA095_11840 [Vibrio rotiferianus]TOM08352.1 hypothetical protein CGH83_23685 [Vibrio parahaemolyticus]MDW1578195.1 hypothetical protein [Vibrio sp. Vb2880]RZR25270.1 hypothetical protein D8T63_13205 [Vibrio vulnificus]
MRLESDLEKVMSKIESFEWNLCTYIFCEQSISMSSRILIIDDDLEEERDDDDEPIYPIEKGYKSFLSVADLQSVKSNLHEQKTDFSSSELLSAVKYYYENDAFIQINS